MYSLQTRNINHISGEIFVNCIKWNKCFAISFILQFHAEIVNKSDSKYSFVAKYFDNATGKNDLKV